MKIIIKNEIKNKRCIIKEDGQKIHKKIHRLLKEKKIVTLDFDGITQFAGPFFNFAIGQLLKDITEKDLYHLLRIENLNEAGKLIVKRVIENAAKHYNKENDTNYKEIVNNIIKEDRHNNQTYSTDT